MWKIDFITCGQRVTLGVAVGMSVPVPARVAAVGRASSQVNGAKWPERKVSAKENEEKSE